RGGALKRGRFARLMQFMKLRLPYQLSSLDWDPQHLTNQQQCYHPECHTPAVEPEADGDSWICRQCVFAVATKRGGALKRGRFARLMQFMKLRLPYQLSSLDWDPQHLTNQQQCYCYCAGPGEWNLKMLQCAGCGQWFHEACTQCLTKPLLYGDRFYQFQCSVCAKGPETIQRLPMNWADLAHLVLYHLSLCCKRKYFDFDHEILSFANENWESLLLGALSDTPRQDRCHNLLNALNSHKDRFVSGKEIKKKKCLFGLQVRAPPPLTSDSSPLITDPPIAITHRRRADLAHLVLYHLSLCCKRKYFDFDHEILSFANENWESLLLGALSDTPRQDRCHNLLNALNSHKDRFVSGKEIKKKKCLFGLQVRAPPPLTSDSSPLITDPPIAITHRRRVDFKVPILIPEAAQLIIPPPPCRRLCGFWTLSPK
ncbi:unnamed protein product, partial [Menidia menidia]